MAGLLPFLLLGMAGAPLPADPCASAPSAPSITARVVTARTARDSTLTATVCIVPARAGAAPTIGSYHGELHFDSATVAVVRVVKAEGGVRVENSAVKGQVNFAGAAPAGLPGRALVTVVLKLAQPAAAPPLRLEMKELNSTGGRSLMPQLVVAESPR